MPQPSQPSWHPEQLAARLPFLRRRARLAQAVRAFFTARGYTEVETPYAVTTPGEEVHLAAFRTERVGVDGRRQPLWLHTSPEFAMKRLLVGGAGPIFQLARVWRNEQGSARHAAEFTMLEWYRPGATMDDLMAECLALLRAVLPPEVRSGGVTTRLAEAEFIALATAFRDRLGVDLLATADDAAALAHAAGVVLRTPPASSCARPKAGKTCFSDFCSATSSRISARPGRAFSPTGPPPRPPWPAATLPIPGSPNASSSMSAAWNSPTPSSNSPTLPSSARASPPTARDGTC